MRIKISKEFLIFSSIVTVSILGLLFFMKTSYFDSIQIWAQQNLILYLLFITLIKILGIVYPPFSGGILTLGSIPVIGWELAYFTDFVGSTVGGIANYFLAKKYGKNIIKKFLGPEAEKRISSIKIKKGREIESIIVTRIFVGSVVLELIHYVAGILHIKFSQYLIGIIISHVIVGIPSFYLFSNIFENKGSLTIISIFLILLAVPILYKLKGRYFE